jgi:uncharacterized protein YndB with AHSA1/START domain
MSNPADSTRIQVRRRMPAPREIVYEAWTNASEFRHWMCPGDVVSAEATLDVRVGGAFRIVMKSKTAEHVHTGTYQIVDPPAKLVFTWMASNHPPTLVTVEFLDHGEESELLITHERFTLGDIAKRYESGWGTIADKLAAHLSSAQNKSQAHG